MRGVASALLGLALLVAGSASSAELPGGGGRIVFASERAPDFQRTRFVAATRLRPQIAELGIAPLGAVLAPDRSRYAYGGSGGLVVASLRGTAPPMVVPTAHRVEDIAWSRDGRAIAFTVSDPSPCRSGDRLCAVYRLFVVPSAGGEARKLADAARFPTWSPNGRWIAFAGEWRPADASFTGTSGMPHIVRADGSGLKRLVRVRGVHALAWSPGSDRLVFSTGNDVVATVRLAGGARRLGSGRSVAWSRRGVIAFAPMTGPIELVRPDGRRVRRIRPLGGVDDLVWSPAGGELAYVARGPETPPARRVAVVRADGRRARVLLDADRFTTLAQLAWTRDGTRVLVATSRREDNDTDLFSMRADGTDVRKLTDDAEWQFEPAWSPDGSRIVFAGGFRGTFPQSRLFTIAAEGGTATALTVPPPGTDDHQPAWSPDGRSIVFVRSHAAEGLHDSDLFLVRPDGSELRQVAELGGQVWGPAWSPDGSRIAFGRFAAFHGVLAVVNADGTGYVELTNAWGSPLPAWAPDGLRLAFVDPFNARLLVYRLTDGGAQPIAGNVDPRSAPAWSPDGSRIAFLGTDGELHSVAASGGDEAVLTLEPGRDQDPDWSRVGG